MLSELHYYTPAPSFHYFGFNDADRLILCFFDHEDNIALNLQERPAGADVEAVDEPAVLIEDV